MKVETNFNTDRTDMEWKNQCGLNEEKKQFNNAPKVTTPNTAMQVMQDTKKSFERDGDWTCQRCQNVNFSYRFACN